MGLGEATGDITDGALGGAGHVVGPLAEDARRVRRLRVRHTGGGAQDGVLNFDGLAGVRRAIGVVGDHHRHRFAGVAHFGAGKRGLGVGAEPRRRHQRRHRRGALR